MPPACVNDTRKERRTNLGASILVPNRHSSIGSVSYLLFVIEGVEVVPGVAMRR